MTELVCTDTGEPTGVEVEVSGDRSLVWFKRAGRTVATVFVHFDEGDEDGDGRIPLQFEVAVYTSDGRGDLLRKQVELP